MRELQQSSYETLGPTPRQLIRWGCWLFWARQLSFWLAVLFALLLLAGITSGHLKSVNWILAVGCIMLLFYAFSIKQQRQERYKKSVASQAGLACPECGRFYGLEEVLRQHHACEKAFREPVVEDFWSPGCGYVTLQCPQCQARTRWFYEGDHYTAWHLDGVETRSVQGQDLSE